MTTAAKILSGLVALLMTGTAQAVCTLGKVAELPVMMEGLSPIIDVRLNGIREKMIVDSGAFFSMLSPSVAQELKLKLRPSTELTGVGGSFGSDIGQVNTVELAPGVSIGKALFLVGGNIGSGGLIGQDLLRFADVEYDLGAGMIRLLRPHDCGQANLAYWAGNKPVSRIDISSTTVLNPHTIATVYLNGVKIRAMFDTGASTSMLSLGAATRAGVKPGDKGVRPAGETHGLGRAAVKTWIAPFASFKIGAEEIQHTNLRIGQLRDLDVDMLIGADFFLSHHVFVSTLQHALYFTYNGGPVFNLSITSQDGPGDASPAAGPAALIDGPEPVEADGFARRGAARLSRQDYKGGLADLSHAVALAPRVASYRVARANAYLSARDFDHAIADLDEAVKLSPGDSDTLLMRAALHLRRKEFPAALADVDAASATMSPKSRRFLALADIYADLDAFDRSIAQVNAWFAANPGSSHDAGALKARCWARALAGKDLDAALSDCNTAHLVVPSAGSILDSRGLVRLRRGEYGQAIADYNDALERSANQAWSLYGRGIAETHLGQTTQGGTDIAAALKLYPELADRAKRLNIAP